MTRESYIKATAFLRKSEKRAKRANQINQILVSFVSIQYPLFLLVLFRDKHPFLLRAIVVPAVSYVLVSLFRKLCNVPRPYEKFNLPPALKKETEGKSFPSRHVFSAFVIAITIFTVFPTAGVIVGMAGIGLALLRVLGGVHEPRDVIAGALVGLVSGMVGYYML
ncbi:MAG: phosphatase PAP2 family protein [Roseburia sp.]